jgi:hypothetical protein
VPVWRALHESENEVLVDYLRFSAREPKRNGRGSDAE